MGFNAAFVALNTIPITSNPSPTARYHMTVIYGKDAHKRVISVCHVIMILFLYHNS